MTQLISKSGSCILYTFVISVSVLYAMQSKYFEDSYKYVKYIVIHNQYWRSFSLGVECGTNAHSL
jgi:hypothetical protein